MTSRTFRSHETPEGMRTDVAYAEKRAATRKALHSACVLQRDGAPSMSARTVDISSTGVCVLVSQSLPFNEPWNISFDISLDGVVHNVQTLAEVQQMIVSADGVRIGFHFKRMNMASMIAISRFVGEGISQI